MFYLLYYITIKFATRYVPNEDFFLIQKRSLSYNCPFKMLLFKSFKKMLIIQQKYVIFILSNNFIFITYNNIAIEQLKKFRIPLLKQGLKKAGISLPQQELKKVGISLPQQELKIVCGYHKRQPQFLIIGELNEESKNLLY